MFFVSVCGRWFIVSYLDRNWNLAPLQDVSSETVCAPWQFVVFSGVHILAISYPLLWHSGTSRYVEHENIMKLKGTPGDVPGDMFRTYVGVVCPYPKVLVMKRSSFSINTHNCRVCSSVSWSFVCCGMRPTHRLVAKLPILRYNLPSSVESPVNSPYNK